MPTTGKITSYDLLIDGLRLVRWPNLIMAALTLALTRYAIIGPFYTEGGLIPLTTHLLFFLMAGATVLVMAGGYIINDLYDVATDKINRPDKQIIGFTYTPQGASNLYYILTGIGWAMAGLASSLMGRHEPVLIVGLCTGLLYFYSVRYKRQPFIGNLVISLLSAMLIGIIWVTELYNLLEHPEVMGTLISKLPRLYTLLTGFTLFAFTSSMVREWIKDCEDISGDEQTNCKTLAVKIGIKKMRLLIAGLILLNIITLAWFQYLIYHQNYSVTTFYLMVVQYLWLRLLESILSKKETDWHNASSQAKIIMLAGVLAMQTLSIDF
ncbi:MAG TPA: hypothetical protein DCR43_01190 [Bacteroidales bacterium]|nr:MAG: hypothetical protein A2X11_15015 [Bacteroidetes bacterium GWE2_42_24]HAQ64466.1 hypothetical protein [Bacteroidales bacterium]HBZ67082.1 hypothetical protein [Bacteroidales bacterium]